MSIFHTENNFLLQKIDPYYVPIQVESYITKCESMGSILEHLTPHKENENNQAMKFTLPVDVTKNEATALQKAHSYVLQPPPLKPQLDLSRTESSDSLDSSDYQSSRTSIATSVSPLHVAPRKEELSTDATLQSIVGHRVTACSNLSFEQKQCRAYSSSDDESFSSQSIASSQDAQTSLRLPSSYDKLILSTPDGYSAVEEPQDNRIVLTFSSSLSCNYTENVIFIEQESNDTDTFSEDSNQEEVQGHENIDGSLANMNLTINPHHFDPL